MYHSSFVTLGGFLVAGALSFAMLVPVAAAYSDAENSYIQQVQAAGVIGDPGKLVETAHAVCRHTGEGVSVDDMANTLAQGSTNVNGASAITIDQAFGMVRTAQTTVCPAPQGNVGQPDCEAIDAALQTVPPGTTDVLGALKVVPGLDKVDSGAMFTCGLGAAMNDPSSVGNNQNFFNGMCRGIEGLAPFDAARDFVCGTPVS